MLFKNTSLTFWCKDLKQYWGLTVNNNIMRRSGQKILTGNYVSKVGFECI